MYTLFDTLNNFKMFYLKWLKLVLSKIKIVKLCKAEMHMANADLYHMADEHTISEMICERQHQFTGHCVRMPKDEPVNIYVIYQSKIRQSNRCGNPGLTYLDQISKYLSTDKTVRFSAEEIANYAMDKQLWNLSITVHKLPAWWSENTYLYYIVLYDTELQ